MAMISLENISGVLEDIRLKMYAYSANCSPIYIFLPAVFPQGKILFQVLCGQTVFRIQLNSSGFALLPLVLRMVLEKHW